METLRKQDARDPKCKSESAATHLAEHEVPSLDQGTAGEVKDSAFCSRLLDVTPLNNAINPFK